MIELVCLGLVLVLAGFTAGTVYGWSKAWKCQEELQQTERTFLTKQTEDLRAQVIDDLEAMIADLRGSEN